MVVVGGVYIASLRYAFFLQTRTFSVEAMAGVVEFRHGGVPSSSVTRHNWKMRHGAKISLVGYDWLVRLPMSYPTIGLGVLAALAGGPALRRRLGPAPAGQCPKCRYDLRGLPKGSACPECGRGAA